MLNILRCHDRQKIHFLLLPAEQDRPGRNGQCMYAAVKREYNELFLDILPLVAY